MLSAQLLKKFTVNLAHSVLHWARPAYHIISNFSVYPSKHKERPGTSLTTLATSGYWGWPLWSQCHLMLSHFLQSPTGQVVQRCSLTCFRGEMLSEMQLLKAATQQARSQQLLTTGTGAFMTAKTPAASRVEVFPLAQWGLDKNSAPMLSGKLWAVCSGIWPAQPSGGTLQYHLWCWTAWPCSGIGASALKFITS